MPADESEDGIVESTCIRFRRAMAAAVELNQLCGRYNAGELPAEIEWRQDVVLCTDDQCGQLDCAERSCAVEVYNRVDPARHDLRRGKVRDNYLLTLFQNPDVLVDPPVGVKEHRGRSDIGGGACLGEQGAAHREHS